MTVVERAELEARAERCTRRGELREAIGLYRTLHQAFPDDGPLGRKLQALEQSLQPSELLSARAFAPEPYATRAGPEQEGERLFALGDYAGAMGAYRRALKQKPGSDLIRERLEELYTLAQSAPRQAASPTDKALPQEPSARLGALLDRIAARRRR
jgi:tetratricopeptide (TPR) repeat protein